MAIKSSKNVYLYLALACFIAIIVIFIVDGYMGIYDTLDITIQEREREIEPGFWEDRWAKEHGYSTGGEWGEPVYFQYEIDNRQTSTYLTSVKISVWKSGMQISELLNEAISIAAFDKATVEWILQTDDLEKDGFDVGEYTVKIKHGEVERKIIVGFHYTDGDAYPPVYPRKEPPLPINE